jgi:homoserine O-acetyltransferase/O-succinyltransferase
MFRPVLLLFAATLACAQQPVFDIKEADFVARDFTFHGGEKLAELKLHYTTVGQPRRDASGHVRNAVLIMHGTGGTGRPFLGAGFGGELFGKGQPLDVSKYYVILPDSVGHGGSSKPSDGLRAKFPHYDYEDMVRADYRLVTEGLGVDHLRLVMGTSMGAMHSWVWGYLYPDFMDALMPLASAPVEIAGRNRMFRAMIMQAIKADPVYKNGDYDKPPVDGLVAAQYALWMMTSSPLQLHKTNETHEKADAAVAALRQRAARVDANDMMYQYDSSTDYNPAPHLGKIRAPLFAVNSADDEVNPPELGIMEREIQKVAQGRYILIPTSDQTRGHGTHSRAALWKNDLLELLQVSEPVHSTRAARELDLNPDPKAAEWASVPAVTMSRDYLGQPIPGAPTEIRSRWTKDNLYLLYICPFTELNLKPDPNTAAETDKLWNWDVAEAFIGADYEKIGRYKEFEVSPRGEWVDLDIDRDNAAAQQGVAWNSGFAVKGRIDQRAKIWYAVMRIPFSSIDSRPAEPGRELRIGLYRCAGVDPRQYFAWHPTGQKSFHQPKAFGTLRLE